jgi:hypothetical protein
MNYQFGTKNGLPVLWLPPKLYHQHLRLKDVNPLLQALAKGKSAEALAMIEAGEVDVHECEGAALFLAGLRPEHGAVMDALIARNVVLKNKRAFMTLLSDAIRKSDEKRADILLAYGQKHDVLEKKDADYIFTAAARYMPYAFYDRLIKAGLELSGKHETHDEIKLIDGSSTIWAGLLREPRDEVAQRKLLEDMFFHLKIPRRKIDNVFFKAMRAKDWALLSKDYLTGLVDDLIEAKQPAALLAIMKHGTMVSRAQAIAALGVFAGDKDYALCERLFTLVEPPCFEIYENNWYADNILVTSLKSAHGEDYLDYYLNNNQIVKSEEWAKIVEIFGMTFDEKEEVLLDLFYKMEPAVFYREAKDYLPEKALHPRIWQVMKNVDKEDAGYEIYQRFLAEFQQKLKAQCEASQAATAENVCLYVQAGEIEAAIAKKIVCKDTLMKPVVLATIKYAGEMAKIWDERIWGEDAKGARAFYLSLRGDEQLSQQQYFAVLENKLITKAARRDVKPFRMKR